MKVEGTIDNIYKKSKVSRAGKPFNIWYANVDGQEVNLGFSTTMHEGQVVSLDVEESYGELKVVDPAKGPSSSGPRSAPPAKGGYSGGAKGKGSFPIQSTDGQMSIIRQSSLNRAVEVVMNAPYADGMDKETLLEEIFDVAYRFTDFASGQREVRIAKDSEAA